MLQGEYVHIGLWLRVQERVLISLELELQAILSLQAWVLGTKLESFERIVNNS